MTQGGISIKKIDGYWHVDATGSYRDPQKFDEWRACAMRNQYAICSVERDIAEESRRKKIRDEFHLYGEAA